MPTPDNNKVEFGISQLHVGTYEIDSKGDVVLGTPYHQKGAVSLSLDPESEDNNFFADNVKYYSGYSDNGYTGSIEVAKFDTDFKTQFLGYAAVTGGGVAKVKTKNAPKTYVAFQTEGDAEARRVLLLNVSFGEIQREFSTIEENKEPVTETIDITVDGDNNTGITQVTFKPADTGYSTLFSAPTMPAIATGTGG